MKYAQTQLEFHHIDQAQAGREYRCPRCELPVDRSQDQFVHTVPNLTCGMQSENEIHFLAKKIISIFGVMRLPEMKEKQGLHHIITEKAKSMFYVDVEARGRDNRPLIIEINLHHPVNEKKKRFFREQNLDAFEIEINDADMPRDPVDYILHSAPRKWIHHADRSIPFMESQTLESDLNGPGEHPLYPARALMDYFHFLRQQYENLEQKIFEGILVGENSYSGLPRSVRYFIKQKKLYHGLIKHMCVLPGEHSMKKTDLGKAVTFRLNCDPQRFIYNPLTKYSLFLPLAVQIKWKDT